MKMKTVSEWIDQVAHELDHSDACFGHGTDNAHDEAAWLVLHVLGLPFDGSFRDGSHPVDQQAATRIRALLSTRLLERKPLAYLLGEAWFCGLPFWVDESVLVPRSPIAELIQTGFHPWVPRGGVHRALDLCTGSGCIAIAMAMHDAALDIDAVDISRSALATAARNLRRHGCEDRVSLVVSDLFAGLQGRQYDLIVSNPPYVAAAEMRKLPREYTWEPHLGLEADHHGLSVVRRILRAAPDFLTPDGVMIMEVGQTAANLMRCWPELPVTWIEFEHGGEGVFTIGRCELEAARALLGRAPR